MGLRSWWVPFWFLWWRRRWVPYRDWTFCFFRNAFFDIEIHTSTSLEFTFIGSCITNAFTLDPVDTITIDIGIANLSTTINITLSFSNFRFVTTSTSHVYFFQIHDHFISSNYRWRSFCCLWSLNGLLNDFFNKENGVRMGRHVAAKCSCNTKANACIPIDTITVMICITVPFAVL